MATKRGRATGTLDADGFTDEVVTDGPVMIRATGTFGGGTLKVQRESAGSYGPVYDEATALELTAAAEHRIDLVGSNLVRMELDGATSPDLDWEIASFEP